MLLSVVCIFPITNLLLNQCNFFNVIYHKQVCLLFYFVEIKLWFPHKLPRIILYPKIDHLSCRCTKLEKEGEMKRTNRHTRFIFIHIWSEIMREAIRSMAKVIYINFAPTGFSTQKRNLILKFTWKSSRTNANTVILPIINWLKIGITKMERKPIEEPQKLVARMTTNYPLDYL